MYYRVFALLYCLICPVISIGRPPPSVIIVGAGPSGVAAAAKLIENGISDLKVLEAEDRIGGRVNSVKFGDAFVDLGAEFCHGQKDNIVYNMVKDLDPEILQRSPADFPGTAHDSKGEKIDNDLFKEIISFVLLNFEELAAKYNVELEKNADTTSLGDYVLNMYNNTIMEKYKSDAEKLKVCQDAKRFLEKCFLSLEGSFDWYQPSAMGHHEECEGDQQMTWKGHGYKIILDILMKAYPNPKEKLNINFLLNKEVTKIDWSSGNQISIECKDQSKYTADHLIFTPSVGVLKAQHAELFNPQLPISKQDAIKGIGFDGLMKIIMHFPQKWWQEEILYLSLIWSAEDLAKSGQEFSQGLVKDGVSWVTQINGLATSANNSNVLIAWVSGPWVPEIEQLPKETLKEGMVFLIKKFLSKDYKVTEPDQLIHSSWCSNPHFRGTYSYETPESHEKGLWNQKEYLQPLNNTDGIPKILFAGEATHPTLFSTVHGAIESGQREANRILNLYQDSH